MIQGVSSLKVSEIVGKSFDCVDLVKVICDTVWRQVQDKK